MTKLSSKILEKIKREKMTPKPRWYFALMHTLLGTAILSSVMIGGIAVAIVIRDLTLTDWELARQFAGGYTRSFIMLIPYIWLIFIGLTILIADSLYKHTKKGHRIRLWQLIAISITLSVIFGILFFFAKADQPIEESLNKNFQPYAAWKNKRDQVFVAPEKGVIAGKLVKREESEREEWKIIDFKGKEWTVDINNTADFELQKGMSVVIKGERTNGEHFKAEGIKPWRTDKAPLAPLNKFPKKIPAAPLPNDIKGNH